MIPNLAFVTSGGGMTCAYSVGAILALKDRYGLTTPNWAIGSSGSTGTLAYGVAGQYHCFRNIWENLLSVKEFINFKRVRPIIDIDYLIDEVFKKQSPLDSQEVKDSPTELLIAATNCKTGEVRHFSNREEVDIFEVLRASKAMPGAYGKKVTIQGEKYFDGALAASVAVNIREAIIRGAKNIIVINNNTNNMGWKLADIATSFALNPKVAKAMRKAAINPFKIHALGVKIIHVQPSRPLPVSMLDNNPKRIRATIDMGYEDVANNPELKNL